MLRLVAIVRVLMMKRLKISPSRKSGGSMRYLISLCSDADSAPFVKRWVSLDSFGYGWGSQLEALPEWLRAKFAGLLAQGYKERSSRRATQGSHPNKSLQKLTLHRYNKLSSRQVRGTYELSWYHSILIIKLWLLSTSILFEYYVSSTTGFERS